MRRSKQEREHEAKEAARRAARAPRAISDRSLLERWMRRAGVSAAQLAEHAGVCEVTTYRWGRTLPVPVYVWEHLRLLTRNLQLVREVKALKGAAA